MKSRTRARSLALQVLYEVDQSSHDIGEIVNQRLERDSAGRKFTTICA